MKRTLMFTLMIILPLVLAISFLTPALVLSAEKLVLVGSKDTKESMHGRWLTLIYTEVFQRLGIDWSYEAYSSARASALSDSGEADGEINRVSGYNSVHPNLLRVGESHFPTRLVAYAVRPGIKIDSWSSLKDTSYRVEYRRGTKIVRDGLAPVVAPNNLSSVITVEQGLKKLLSDRTDIYIDVEDLVTEVLLRLDAEKFDPSRVYKAGLLAEDSLHMFLHKNKAHLIRAVNQTLREMKEEGLVDKVINNTF